MMELKGGVLVAVLGLGGTKMVIAIAHYPFYLRKSAKIRIEGIRIVSSILSESMTDNVNNSFETNF